METLDTPRPSRPRLMPVSPLGPEPVVLPVAVLPARLQAVLRSGAAAQDLLDAWGPSDTEAVLAAARRHPEHAEILGLVLAQTLERAGRPAQALDALDAVLGVRATVPLLTAAAWLAVDQAGRRRALVYRRRALALDPDNADLTREAAFDLMHLGDLDGGLALLRDYCDRCPDDVTLSAIGLVFTHYRPDYDRTALAASYRRWARHHFPVARAARTHANTPDPHRRLRIGYVSPDFYKHVVLYNFAALLRCHRRADFELFAYASVRHPDETTERLRGDFDHFRLVHDLSDEALAARIRDDGIDILVEVAGVVGGHRLGAFAYKPAPIQVDFQGIDTTGLEQIDYRFSDVLLDPEDAERTYVEKTVFLAGGVHCYTPRRHTPPVVPPPCLERGFVTFGSFNANLKLNAPTVGLWARLLRAVPDARMLIKLQHVDPDTRPTIEGWFRAAGIDPRRLHVCAGCREDLRHLALFNEVDVVLDARPHNGCITTLEALWMGVPVLTYPGESLVARAGASLLHHAGLDFLIAESPEDFAARGAALAARPDHLARMRAGLRAKLRASRLMDARSHVREIEAAYRWMWQRWCERVTAEGSDA